MRKEWRRGQRFDAFITLSLVLVVLATSSCFGGPSASTHPTPTATSAPPSCDHAATDANPVLSENLCAGTTAWRQTEPTGPESAIEGFTAPVSASAGQTVYLYVSTTSPTYAFRVFRMGWYGGAGARLIYTSDTEPGIAQPAPTTDPATRMVSCSWRDPVGLTIPASWVSGVYIIKLTAANGDVRYTSFVVRNDQSKAPILFQVAVVTYQAYNLWGGYSLYLGKGSLASAPPGAPDEQLTYTDRAYAVSFDRPNTAQSYAGLGLIARWELNLIPWLESQGYNMTYTTDIDTDLTPASVSGRQLIIFGGHDEYWSSAMRAHVTTARDKGTSLAFFTANDVYWHIRFASSPLGADRIVVCYRVAALDPLAASDPVESTVRWRDPPLNDPEDALLGEMYSQQTVTDTVAPLVLRSGAASLIAGTPYQQQSQIPNLVGGEVDAVANPETVPSLTLIASSLVPCFPSTYCPAGTNIVADSTLYTASSGARVFDAGTFYWASGLADLYQPEGLTFALHPQPGFQILTANLLAYLLRSKS